MKKQDYLDMYNFHKEMNEKLENETDVFERLSSPDLSERIERNRAAMSHAKNILARYFKTFLN